MKTKWIYQGNTGLYMVEKYEPSLLLPEWHPVGQVTLRQAYEKIPPQWTAFLLIPHRTPTQWVGAYGERNNAERAVERAYEAVLGH